ncbi:MAG: GntR family transcriptional regulator [Eubacteriales bacterium]|nr:GntR family transcriptional regulator [Eubacteriales bacterium]
MEQNTKNLKHLNIRKSLLDLIDSSSYQIGDRLMPEMKLCEELKVSRAALRRVLDELQHEEYISRIQGSGTVILKKSTKYSLNLSSLGSAVDVIKGYTTLTTEQFKIFEIRADAKLAQKLEIEQGERVLDVERVRSLDGIPAIYSHNLLVKSRIDYQKNLYANIANSLSATLGTHIVSSDADLQYCRAGEVLANKLHVEPDTMLLLLAELTRIQDGRPIDYAHDYYVANLFDFKIMRRILKTE